MSERLPEFIDPIHLAATGQLLTGELSLSGMRRLAPALSKTQGVVGVELEFGQDAQHIPFLRGHIRARLEVVCQRCLRPVDWDIDVQTSLGIVTSQAQAERLPEYYEPLLVESDLMPLVAIVEDELILNLPDMPKHADTGCLDLDEFRPDEVSRKHPFAVLNQLKSK